MRSLWNRNEKQTPTSTDWTDDIDRLLLSGEEVEDEVAVGDAHVAVTTQRVMVFTPYGKGENVRYVERPNVRGVEERHTGNRQILNVGATVGLTGILLIGIGNTLSFSAPPSLSDLSGEPVPGAELAGSMVSAIELIDTLFLALGVLLLANAAVVGGYYFWSRKPIVVLSVAGDDDVEVVLRDEDDTKDVLRRLRNAVSP
ncbi:MAG: hypothetical protein U5J64_10745 [Halobacteriales archaeon]|nr:hypothetical protein [Halobacteriales archaeon]